jgi:hypothetical protein
MGRLQALAKRVDSSLGCQSKTPQMSGLGNTMCSSLEVVVQHRGAYRAGLLPRLSEATFFLCPIWPLLCTWHSGISPSTYKVTSQAGLGPIPSASINLNYSPQGPVSDAVMA